MTSSPWSGHAAPGFAESHISVVFFAGNRAFKLLKPVETPFLDYRVAEARLAAVDEELRLNRRMAPDVYLGTADVTEHEIVTDRMLVMRRMPAERRLTTLLGQPDWEDHVRAIARRIAQFHESQGPETTAPMATLAAVRKNWEDNTATLEDFASSVFNEGDVEAISRLYGRYLDGRAVLFEERINDGYVCDGHGDLTAEDIFCLDDGPQILDCLAFSDDLRISDVMCDIGFLAMDLERLKDASAGQRLIDWYREFSNEHHPSSLADHYIAYRAHVRAKVACLRLAQGQADQAELARSYLNLCAAHLRKAEVKLVLVGGGPGTGKSSIAAGLSASLGAVVLNTDEIRKDLSGLGHQDRASAPFGEGIYRPEVTENTYQALIEQARLLLERGESVVLDATWTSARHRDAAAALAAETASTFVEIECILPPAKAKERISARAGMVERDDASDATSDIVDAALAARDPWPSAHKLETSTTQAEAIAAAVTTVGSVSAAFEAG